MRALAIALTAVALVVGAILLNDGARQAQAGPAPAPASTAEPESYCIVTQDAAKVCDADAVAWCELNESGREDARGYDDDTDRLLEQTDTSCAEAKASVDGVPVFDPNEEAP